MRLIIPILFLAGAVGLFFFYVNPTYQDIKGLREEAAQFDEALGQSRELQSVRDELLSEYNTFATDDLGRLRKLLPDNVDNVRLVLDLDNIATQYNMRVRDVLVSTQQEGTPERGTVGPDTRPYDSVVLSFSVAATYDDFVAFIEDLESSLRLVDVISISFSEPEGDLTEYDVSVRTYWLK